MLCPCVLQPLLTAPCSARTIKPPLSRRLPPLVAPSRARAPAAGLGGGAGLPPQEDAGLPRPRRCAETDRLRWRLRAARWRHRTAGRPGTAPAPLGRPSKTYYSFPFIELIEMQFVKYIRRPAFLIRWIIQYEYFIRLFVFSPLPLGWVSCIYHQRDASLLQRNTCLGAGCGFMPHGQVFMWRWLFSSRSRGGVYDTKGSRLESQTPVCYSVFFKQWEFIGLWIFMWLLSQHTHTNEVCKITHSPWASASLFSSAVSKVAIKELFLNEGKIHQIR